MGQLLSLDFLYFNSYVYAEVLSKTMKLINYLITRLTVGLSLWDKICNHIQPLMKIFATRKAMNIWFVVIERPRIIPLQRRQVNLILSQTGV